MSEKGRLIGLGFLFGIATGLVLFAVVMAFVIIPGTRAQAAAFKKVSEDSATACDQRVQSVVNTATDFVAHNSAGFTTLIEPAPAQPSPLQLFDVLRPGLGTMLAKLQNSQHQNIAVQWVVPGHVKPATNSPGYSYCWLNEKGEVDPQNCPALGGAQ